MEHEALFYIDASVSLTEEMAQVNWTSIYKQAKSNGGMVLFWNTGFSCLGFTAPGTFCIVFSKDRLNIYLFPHESPNPSPVACEEGT